MMVKLLQQEAQCYFQNRTNLLLAYKDIHHRSQKVHFFLMLLYSNPTLEIPITFITEAAASNALELPPLLTSIWAYSLHLEQSGEQAKKLFSLVSQLHGRNLADKSQLLTELPQWVTQGAGLIESHAFEKRIARVYTKINYQQSKHSLIRQSNEGYTKLILLLVGLRDLHDSTAIWKKILSLIGNFDLDPDRVLDLVVEARLQAKQAKHFLPLLKHFRKESVVLMIGNKLKLQKVKSSSSASLPQKGIYCGPPESFDNVDLQLLFNQVPFLPSPRLSELASRCIKDGVFSYPDLLPYLQPSDSILKRISGKKAQLTLAKISKSFTLSMVEIQQNQLIRIFHEQNLEFQGQLLHSSKLALITEMARCNDWTDFVAAWSSLKNKFDLILYQPLLHALLDLLEWAIDPLLSTSGFQKFFRIQKKQSFFLNENNCKQFTKLETIDLNSLLKLSQLLSFIGRYISFRPKAFIKLCRLFKTISKEKESNSEVMKKVKELIRVYLVPSNGFAENNSPIALQLYSLLQCFDYRFRYECYLLVYRQAMTGSPYVARIFESIKRRQNIVVNNLSKQNKKTFIRKIAKLTHNQALPVLYWIARRIVMEDYEAVVPEIVGVLSNSTPLTLDMTIFVMLYTLNEHKQAPVNVKTHQFQPWFKNVITFISTFFRKYLEADIQPVFDYILLKTGLPFSQLEDQDQLPGALLKLLHQILNKMHGSVMIQQVNKTKFDAIAAGPRLQAEILELSSEVRAAKKSKIMLEKFFWEQNMDHHRGRSLAFNLLVLLSQKRAQVFTKAFIDDLRIVADVFDEYTLLIVQIVRVLLYQAQDYSHYALLMPQNPLPILLLQQKIPLELACQIVRPGIKHIAIMTETEWNKLVVEFTQCYTLCLKDQNYLVKSSRHYEKIEGYLNHYKQRILEFLPPSLFTSFWFLTIDSVYFPAKSYTQKIQDVKKKIEQNTSRRNEKEVERMKGLLEKLIKEQEQQRKKYEETISDQNLRKLEVESLKGDKQKDKKENPLLLFAQSFVQICLLPRMMLDRAEAIYCVKFTTEMIKANKMPATKSIRLVTFIIEYVMNYLPFTTHREASNCLSVFLAQILAIFINWSDSVKLKQDLKKILGVEETQGKDSYPKLRDYLIKLFERVGNIVKSIKEEPYIIKNCLYLLEKVDSIPGYKQQAEELMTHMNELKQLYTAVDMRTILDRQVSILAVKKNDLPQKPQEKKIEEKKVITKPQPQDNSKEGLSKPKDNLKDSNQKETPKELKQTKSPIIMNSSTTVHSKNNDVSTIRTNNDLNAIKSNESTLSVSAIAHQIGSNNNQTQSHPTIPKSDAGSEQIKVKPTDNIKLGEKTEEQKGKNRGENRYSDRPESRFSDRLPDKKNQPQKVDQSKLGKQRDDNSKKQEQKLSNAPPTVPLTQSNKQSKMPETKLETKGGDLPQGIPPPKRLIDVKRQQEQKQQQGGSSQVGQSNVSSQQVAQSSQLRDNSSKPKQQELKKETTDSISKNSKPTSSANVDPTPKPSLTDSQGKLESQKDSREWKQRPKDTVPIKQIKTEQNREENRQVSKDRSRDPSKGPTKDPKQEKVQEERIEKRREENQFQDPKKDNRWKDKEDGRRWDGNKQKAPFYNRERKSQSREEREDRQIRRQDKRDKQREKDKERQRKHEKYRSRSREKYGRR